MNCKNCGYIIGESAKFCSGCGSTVERDLESIANPTSGKLFSQTQCEGAFNKEDVSLGQAQPGNDGKSQESFTAQYSGSVGQSNSSSGQSNSSRSDQSNGGAAPDFQYSVADEVNDIFAEKKSDFPSYSNQSSTATSNPYAVHQEKPWYKKRFNEFSKRQKGAFIAFIVIAVLIIIAAFSAIGGSGRNNTDTTPKGNTDGQVENATVGQKNALRSAKSYLNSLSFSYLGLVKQLEFEKYSSADAIYAADNCGADWNKQAEKSARQYLKTLSFSRQGLIDQLVFEKYTQEQAIYGVDNCGASWNKQAEKSARQYMKTMSLSRQGLIEQLIFDKYTQEQAIYAVNAVGY